MIETTLSRSETLTARHFGKPGQARRLLICFAYYDHRDHETQTASAVRFFQRFDVDFILVTPHSNAWYQYADKQRCYDLIRSIGTGFDETICYGGSMGGYEALKSAALLGARRVLAISPQFSIDPHKVPFETRWRTEADQTRFIDDDMRLSSDIDYCVLSDPFDRLDERHLKLICAAGGAIRRFPVPFGTHFLAHMLSETGLMEGILRDFLADSLDEGVFRKAVRVRRDRSITYLAAVLRKVDRLRKRGTIRDDKLRDAIVERIVGLDTTVPRNHFLKSQLCERTGRTDAAIASAKRAVEANPDHPGFRAHFDRLLENHRELDQ